MHGADLSEADPFARAVAERAVRREGALVLLERGVYLAEPAPARSPGPARPRRPHAAHRPGVQRACERHCFFEEGPRLRQAPERAQGGGALHDQEARLREPVDLGPSIERSVDVRNGRRRRPRDGEDRREREGGARTEGTAHARGLHEIRAQRLELRERIATARRGLGERLGALHDRLRVPLFERSAGRVLAREIAHALEQSQRGAAVRIVRGMNQGASAQALETIERVGLGAPITDSASAASNGASNVAQATSALRSASSSRSQDQAIAARSVAWRAGRSAFGAPRTSSFRSRRASSSVAPSSGIRAAASSSASGSASSRRTIARVVRSPALSCERTEERDAVVLIERRHGHGQLVRSADRLARGHEHARPRAARSDARHASSRLRVELLEVVEDQQDASRRRRSGEGIDLVVLGADQRDAERRCDGGHDLAARARRGQIGPGHHASALPFRRRMLVRQAGLPDAARTP